MSYLANGRTTWLGRVLGAALSHFPWLRRTLRKAYVALHHPVSEAAFLNRFAREQTHVQFLQIGAHDGKTDDHLHQLILTHQWRGILFEPVGYLFERLARTYKDAEGLFLERRAVSSATGTRKFYRLRATSDELPAWYDQLGSFNKSVVLSHKREIPDIENYLIEEDVECVTIADALRTHGLQRVDLILLDTEGADFEILRTLNFGEIRPKLIIYEHKHLGASDAEACVELLSRQGYKVGRVSANNSAAVIASSAGRYFGFFWE